MSVTCCLISDTFCHLHFRTLRRNGGIAQKYAACQLARFFERGPYPAELRP